jgi:hypothetical protein
VDSTQVTTLQKVIPSLPESTPAPGTWFPRCRGRFTPEQPGRLCDRLSLELTGKLPGQFSGELCPSLSARLSRTLSATFPAGSYARLSPRMLRRFPGRLISRFSGRFLGELWSELSANEPGALCPTCRLPDSPDCRLSTIARADTEAEPPAPHYALQISD